MTAIHSLGRKEIQGTLNHGRKFVLPWFVIFTYSSKTPGLGLIVSRKVGNAVIRNKIKRRLREAYRLLPSDLLSSNDIVIIARKRAIQASFKELLASFTFGLKKQRR